MSARAGSMKWFAIALFVISYGCILLLPMWRRRQAKASLEIPGGVAPPLPVEELKRRLQALALAHPEVDVTVAGEMVQVGWNLDPERLRSSADELSAHPTYRLELQIEDRKVVNVRYAQGVIHWESLDADPSLLEPSVVWSWPMEGIGGGEIDSTRTEPGHTGRDMNRSVGHLVELVRTCVFEAGYAWQPVIEIEPSKDVVRETPESRSGTVEVGVSGNGAHFSAGA